MTRLRVIQVGLAGCLLVIVHSQTLGDVRGIVANARMVFAVQSKVNSDIVAGLLKQAFDDPNLQFASDSARNTVFVRANGKAKMQPVMAFIRRIDRLNNIDLPKGFARHGNRKGVVKTIVERRPDGSVEMRMPRDRELRIAGVVIKPGDKVDKGAPLMLLDSSDLISHKVVSEEIVQLEKHLATARSRSARLIARRNSPEEVIAYHKAARLVAAIRAAIDEKNKQRIGIESNGGLHLVKAEADGVVSFIRSRQEHRLAGKALEPGLLLVRITPK